MSHEMCPALLEKPDSDKNFIGQVDLKSNCRGK